MNPDEYLGGHLPTVWALGRRMFPPPILGTRLLKPYVEVNPTLVLHTKVRVWEMKLGIRLYYAYVVRARTLKPGAARVCLIQFLKFEAENRPF